MKQQCICLHAFPFLERYKMWQIHYDCILCAVEIDVLLLLVRSALHTPFKWERQRRASTDAYTRWNKTIYGGEQKKKTANWKYKSNRTHHCEHTTFVVGFIVVVDHFVGFLFSLLFHFIWFFVSNALSQVDLFSFSSKCLAGETMSNNNKHRQEQKQKQHQQKNNSA